VPLWATQGFRHLHQGAIWQRAEEAGAFTVEHIEEYLEPEAISIEKRYRAGPTITPNDGESVSTTAIMFDMDIEAKVEEKNDLRSLQVVAIKKKLIAFTRSAHISASSNLQEEQERELAPEIEGEHHLYWPPRRKALSHSLHRGLLQFFRTGEILAKSPAFPGSYSALSKTSAVPLFAPGLSCFPGDLPVTADFTRTVQETGPNYCSDNYQRGVQWILTSAHYCELTRMVVVSQWEASQPKTYTEARSQVQGLKSNSVL